MRALLTHPAVHDARLGQLPFAAVELVAGHTTDETSLKTAAMQIRALHRNTLRTNTI